MLLLGRMTRIYSMVNWFYQGFLGGGELGVGVETYNIQEALFHVGFVQQITLA